MYLDIYNLFDVRIIKTVTREEKVSYRYIAATYRVIIVNTIAYYLLGERNNTFVIKCRQKFTYILLLRSIDYHDLFN